MTMTINADPSPSSRVVLLNNILDNLLAIENPSDENKSRPTQKTTTIDDVARQVRDIFLDSSQNSAVSADFDRIKKSFDSWELNKKQSDEKDEFASIEAFILEEQVLGSERRKKARLLQASEEVRMAAEISQLKGFRLKSHLGDRETELQNKIADTERAYLQRKMVTAKATQIASADCRAQYTRVKSFFQELHLSRQKALRQSYERSLKIMAIKHRLLATDSRVIALENSCAERMYRKKEHNLNELHMAQNLEEASYLESMLELLDKVQVEKEAAVREMFELRVEDLKNCKDAQSKREEQLNRLISEATLEMANMISHYVEEQKLNDEDDLVRSDKVAAIEREKDFNSHPSKSVACVSELFDTIIWSVATSHFSISMSESSIYSESIYSDDSGYHDETPLGPAIEIEESDPVSLAGTDGPFDFYDSEKKLRDDGCTGYTSKNTESEDNSSEHLGALGQIHLKRLKQGLKLKERAMLKQHSSEIKEERHRYRMAYRELKLRHQRNIDGLLAQCVEERHRLRDGITQRMNKLAENQDLSTKTLQESIEHDVMAMESAWAEHKRLEEAEKKSFDKAQALISAQVFHEVRNALSSVIAMSELANTLQADAKISPSDLVTSVNDMLDQNQAIVSYSLSMLNNILDINKIKTGEFHTKKEAFDLVDLMKQATTMQLAKARAKGVKMSFELPSVRCIVFSDKDIIQRIATNFISNAIKFTDSGGAIQPFIVPADELMPSVINSRCNTEKAQEVAQDGFRLVAVGVADTGCGLSVDMLNKAKAGLYNSDNRGGTSSGAKNSGFGLHLAHQLAGTLGTRLFLSDLTHCHSLLNGSISAALKQNQSIFSGANDRDGYGTVLFFVAPIFEEGKGPLLDAQTQMDKGDYLLSYDGSPPYKFSPQSNGESSGDCFRVLVADDVLMLRKCLTRSILQVFEQATNCNVSVHTACTAEDALRTIMTSRPFDLVISDHQFNPPTTMKPLEVGKERPHISHCTQSKIRPQQLSNFFRSEAFTIEEKDGDLSGMQMLLQVANLENRPKPILILLSGHSFEPDPSCGIIVAQKPLRTNEIVPLLETHAEILIQAGLCFKEDKKSCQKCSVVNQRGTQIFCQDIA